MAGPEATLEHQIVTYAESRGWWWDKIMKTSRNSFPDRVFLRRGRWVLIEVKRDGETARAKQAKRIRELTERGAEAYCFDNLDDAKKILY
jgi:hypothetical protein